VGALLLAAVPPFTTFMGKSLLEEGTSAAGGYGWLIAVYILVSALTGGAVLRVVGRVFLGWGPAEGSHPEEAQPAHEHETRGERDSTPALMLLVPGALLATALVLGLIPGAIPGVERLGAMFVRHSAYSAWMLSGTHIALPVLPPSHVSSEDYLYGALATVGALMAAAVGLFGRPVRASIPTLLRRPGEVAVAGLRGLHSGHIGDYIAWWSAGVSLIGGVCLVALR
jgi:multicomponent Na+:H+ antiporter subunit D